MPLSGPGVNEIIGASSPILRSRVLQLMAAELGLEFAKAETAEESNPAAVMNEEGNER